MVKTKTYQDYMIEMCLRKKPAFVRRSTRRQRRPNRLTYVHTTPKHFTLSNDFPDLNKRILRPRIVIWTHQNDKTPITKWNISRVTH
jgi:hypothetical protein